jgi:hypothetical protein
MRLMGFIDRLLKRPPDDFGQMLFKRLRASGETGQIHRPGQRARAVRGFS